ncbi:hypothetical protein FTUN_7056 [Frigoriglobus tundricola]|uniref:Uncharacterized protein n=1 Tax=Frigoriglobus tundricola TaxID=2774151 RepID=A0A6M5Z0W5_9BACT|nr:hypothetical protein FTUN_7056 [Frigoriglobus tundricola]
MLQSISGRSETYRLFSSIVRDLARGLNTDFIVETGQNKENCDR